MTIPVEAYGIIAVVTGAILTAIGFLIKSLYKKWETYQNEKAKAQAERDSKFDEKLDFIIVKIDKMQESHNQTNLELNTNTVTINQMKENMDERAEEFANLNLRVTGLERWSRKVTMFHNDNHENKLELL